MLYLGYLVHGYAVNLLTFIIIQYMHPPYCLQALKGGRGFRPRGSATGPTQDTGERGDARPHSKDVYFRS